MGPHSSRPIRLALVVLAATLITACGSASSNRAGLGAGRSLAAYSECVRHHGVLDFPDPTGGQGIAKQQIPVGNPKLPSATRACARLMPTSGLGPQQTSQEQQGRVRDLVAFASCLRRNGFPRFPDPTAGGELTHEMLAAAGIELRQPAVRQAADRCAGVTHGLITRASVATFIAGS